MGKNGTQDTDGVTCLNLISISLKEAFSGELKTFPVWLPAALRGTESGEDCGKLVDTGFPDNQSSS